ncbi:MAG: UDP-galactopyranose mutase [Ignavibacteriaceae bacterium]|nr:UDP-galactopyranose mutase [Ignavibacteriaceae bacterium]
MYDYLIAGAGFTGAVLAERLASVSGMKILITDRRPHTGGNAYDYHDSNGVLVHKYGAHIFHTNSDRIWNYISGFTAWNGYIHRVDAMVEGKPVPLPVNLDSLDALFNSREAKDISAALINEYGLNNKVAVLDLIECSNPVLRKAGEVIYEKIYYKYTLKQWELSPRELKKSVTSRLPVYTTRGSSYFNDKYQGLPSGGYSAIFSKLLSKKNIDVITGMPFREAEKTFRFRKIIFTGAADEFFDFVHGSLPYRSLRFENFHYNKSSFQERAVINYPDDRPYTRILEFRKMTLQETAGTTIAYEYPQKYVRGENEPYYPIPSRENELIHKKYRLMADKLNSVTFAGRLADYTYYNMDQAIGRALSIYDKIARKKD